MRARQVSLDASALVSALYNARGGRAQPRAAARSAAQRPSTFSFHVNLHFKSSYISKSRILPKTAPWVAAGALEYLEPWGELKQLIMAVEYVSDS